jgi:DNA-binding NtrC family response regulator
MQITHSGTSAKKAGRFSSYIEARIGLRESGYGLRAGAAPGRREGIFFTIVDALPGNMSRASEHAGINIKNFHEKMARYGLKKEDFKG